MFADESGGHRWQRVPPTESRGRVHTSTITVAVLEPSKAVQIKVDAKDLDYKTCRGSGAGGQHRNKTDSAVQLTHKPTGIKVRCESERSQHNNKQYALEILMSRLHERNLGAYSRKRAHIRSSQIGSGMRGDKRRTIRVQAGTVTDHVTGKSWKYKDYIRGNW